MKTCDIIYACEECGIIVEVKDFHGNKTPKFCKECIKIRNMDSEKRREKRLKEYRLSEKNKMISDINGKARNSGMSYGEFVAKYR